MYAKPVCNEISLGEGNCKSAK